LNRASQVRILPGAPPKVLVTALHGRSEARRKALALPLREDALSLTLSLTLPDDVAAILRGGVLARASLEVLSNRGREAPGWR
ncbi:MAG: hypothetical protein KY395_06075, partial [Actinobacteria bacterium]|nr:hypothetical protein [Actinomycetota bacterium]